MKEKSVGKALNRINTGFNKLVVVLSLLFVGGIFGLSLFRTCSFVYLEDGITYQNFFYRDSFIKHVIVMSLFLLFIFLCRIHGKGVVSSKLIYLILAVYGVLGIVFACTTKWYPANDPCDLWEIARGLIHGDYTEFGKEGYMYRYPFQRGMVLVLYGLIKVFGDNAFWIYQIINVIVTVVTVVLVIRVERRLRVSDSVSNVTSLLYVFFIPMFLYVTFIYGTTIGLLFVVLSIYCCMRAVEDGFVIWAIPSAVFMAAAIQLKSNYSIWAIALVLTVIGQAVMKDRKKVRISLVTALLIVLASGFGGTVTKMAIESIAPVEISKGMPKTAWIVMGISDDDDRPGAFNGKSGELFRNNDYDYDKTNAAALHDIRAILGYTATRPYASIKQYYKKISFMWNDPTFESINNMFGRPSSAYEESAFYDSMLHGTLRKVLEEYMNITQSFLLLLTVLFIFKRRRDLKGWYLLPALVFVGGFVFHIAWEVKPQYAYPYYLMLIPYAGAVLAKLLDY